MKHEQQQQQRANHTGYTMYNTLRIATKRLKCMPLERRPTMMLDMPRRLSGEIVCISACVCARARAVVRQVQGSYTQFFLLFARNKVFCIKAR